MHGIALNRIALHIIAFLESQNDKSDLPEYLQQGVICRRKMAGRREHCRDLGGNEVRLMAIKS